MGANRLPLFCETTETDTCSRMFGKTGFTARVWISEKFLLTRVFPLVWFDDYLWYVCETLHTFLTEYSNLQHEAANAQLMVMLTFELRCMLLTVNDVLFDTLRLLYSTLARCQWLQVTVCWTALSRSRTLSSRVIAPSDLLSWIVWQEDKHICEQCSAFFASGLECPYIIVRHF